MGKVEGIGKQWHGHVTAVTVAADYRQLGLATKMMEILESTSEEVFDAYFVDLFVRASNSLAINMYKRFGYSVYRRVVGYYSSDMTAVDGEDAFGIVSWVYFCLCTNFRHEETAEARQAKTIRSRQW